jgi:hypothetical protein
MGRKRDFNDVPDAIKVTPRTTNYMVHKKLASRTTFPIELAYARTIHKSQGSSYNSGIVDVGTAKTQRKVMEAEASSLEEDVEEEEEEEEEDDEEEWDRDDALVRGYETLSEEDEIHEDVDEDGDVPELEQAAPAHQYVRIEYQSRGSPHVHNMFANGSYHVQTLGETPLGATAA